jgi:hypothetical protein
MSRPLKCVEEREAEQRMVKIDAWVRYIGKRMENAVAWMPSQDGRPEIVLSWLLHG